VVDPTTVVERSPRSERRSHRWARWSAIGLGGVVVLYLAVLFVAPLVPRLRVARGGWRLYSCQQLGGSIPADFRSMVRVNPGLAMSSPVAVRDGELVYVAEKTWDANGDDLGVAVWTAADRIGGPFHPALAANDLARRVAENPDGATSEPATGPIGASVACAASQPRP
jgi:hypothetical protein